MSCIKWKVRVFGAFAILALLAGAISCKGFFVNPTLTTLTVSPVNPSIELGQTLQMTATGTYDDGSTSTNVKNLSWTISPTTDATISSTGLVTGVAVSSTASTITASSAAVSGTTTVTVVLANVNSITVMPSSGTAIIGGAAAPFTATANVQGQSAVDITGSAIWQVVQNGAVATDVMCTFVAPSEQCTAQQGATPGTYSINVTYAGTNAVGTATLNVAQ